MEILDPSPPELGVTESDVYVLDDDDWVIAGPFGTETDALKRIEKTVANPRALFHTERGGTNFGLTSGTSPPRHRES